MAAASSYTEATLAAWMQRELLGTAEALEWTDPAHAGYQRAVEQVERVLGGPIASQTDMVKVEAAARVEVWRSVLNERASDYKFSTLAGTDERQQAFEQAEKMFKLARAGAATLGLYPEVEESGARRPAAGRTVAVRTEPTW